MEVHMQELEQAIRERAYHGFRSGDCKQAGDEEKSKSHHDQRHSGQKKT
jgi:hypothetical protein